MLADVLLLVLYLKHHHHQHAQGLYKAFGKRNYLTCDGDTYTCPRLSLGLNGSWQILCQQWLPYFSPTKKARYRLEKTPDLALSFLADIGAPLGSRLLLVQRHPLLWHFSFGKRIGSIVPVSPTGAIALCRNPGDQRCPLIWLDVWMRTLSTLTSSSTHWHIMRYEALAFDPKRTIRDVLESLFDASMARSYPYDKLILSTERRRLKYHASGLSNGETADVEVNSQWTWKLSVETQRKWMEWSKCTPDEACCSLIYFIRTNFEYEFSDIRNSSVFLKWTPSRAVNIIQSFQNFQDAWAQPDTDPYVSTNRVFSNCWSRH